MVISPHSSVSPVASPSRPRIVAALSGGVDSSTVAALLQEQGYAVEGVTLWLMRGKGQCCTEGLVDAAAVCEQLGIPHHVVDSRELFQANIVDYLVAGYAEGITPLPCSQCNKTVKFGPLLAYAREKLGISQIATGHYARVRLDTESGRYQLLRAVDRQKDQSYFLYDLSQDHLASSRFPLGEYTKAQTRQLAARYGLVTADKPESQDLCLIETYGSMRSFLDQYLGQRPGEIVDTQGRVLGSHEGIHHYTVGQRKGLGIASSRPLYVVRIDAAMNRVVVGEREEATQAEAWVSQVNWVSIPAPTASLAVEVQVRYRTPPVPAMVIPESPERVKLQFAEPQFGVTPGQAAVWYHGDLLLGGGILERPSP
ncbi:tRNA 2-thiouridine(34) synthase MnmA [Synechococcus sp. W60.1]|uniref:tRNA 2-thiouridine(34) synthase MnmA n=1 Tax=Synechococcus sp. W60.1 TaxID=2964516 RepID=UPI0039C450E2